MLIELAKEALSPILSAINRHSESNSQINVHLFQDVLEMSSNHQDFRFIGRFKLPETDKFQAFSLNARQFNRIVAQCNTDKVKLDYDWPNFTVKYGKSRYKLAIASHNPIYYDPYTNAESMNARIYTDYIQKLVAPFAAAPKFDILSGVLFHWSIEDNTLTNVALDNYQMSHLLWDVESVVKEDNSIVIPAAPLIEVGKLIEDREQIFIASSTHGYQFIIDPYVIETSTLQGHYPPYTRLLPQSECKYHINVQVQTLNDALNRLKAVIDKELASKLITITADMCEIHICAATDDGDSGEEEVEAKTTLPIYPTAFTVNNTMLQNLLACNSKSEMKDLYLD